MIAKRHRFLRKVWSTVHKHAMLTRGDRVVVAVSGGADSVAALLTLHAFSRALSLQLTVAHLDHGLRPNSCEDRRFVLSLATKLGLTAHIRELSPGALGQNNVEARARAARYEFLQEIASLAGGAKIATGHTMDDQAETVLLRLLRGSTLRGLRGIRPVRQDGVIRPLIACTREEVRQFLEDQRCSWCEDETNQDPRFLRNRVRSELLPVLCSWNPSLSRVIARAADIAREEARALEVLVKEKLKSATNPDGTLCLSSLQGLDPAVRSLVVQAWLAEQFGEVRSVGQCHRLRSLARAFVVQSVSCSAGEGADRSLGSSIVWRDDRVRFGSKRSFAAASERTVGWEPVPLVVGKALDLPNGWRLWPYLRTPGEVTLPVGRGDDLVAFVDSDALVGPLLVRPVCPGDRIVPVGMKGTRKLQDVFTDRRIPRDERWGRPAVVSGSCIIWVPGVVRSAQALVTSRTQQVLELRAMCLQS